MILYPQLPHAVAEQLTSERRRLPIAEAANLRSFDHPDLLYTPTGGTRVDPDTLQRLAELLISAATKTGYPSKGDPQSFDQSAASILYSAMNISAAEASKPGVWEFLSCVVLPDLVRWRFPGDDMGSPPERFLASRRNAFQRLWWRSFTFYDADAAEPYHLLQSLGEDETVQIMERPFLAGSRSLSKTVAVELLRAAKQYPSISRRTLIREVQKRLRRLGAFTSFESIDETTMLPFVRELFERVAIAAI